MGDEVANRLLELDKENERLEQELVSPSPVRRTEYAAASDSPDGTLRTIARIAERLHLSIGELAADKVPLPTFH
jgi:hypothetical protein